MQYRGALAILVQVLQWYMHGTVDTMMAPYDTKCRLSWFSSFRRGSHTGRREVERSEIELMISSGGQQLIVDGKYDDVSEWIIDENRGLLVLKMCTITAPRQVRYYAFEKIEKTKAGHVLALPALVQG